MNLLRKVALAWMFAWLPMSGVMASTMPFCAQGLGGMVDAAMAIERADGMPCHGDGATQADAGTMLPVEHCDLCHVAGAVVPPSLRIVANATPSVTPLDAAPSDFRSFIPDPLQHPPLPSPV